MPTRRATWQATRSAGAAEGAELLGYLTANPPLSCSPRRLSTIAIASAAPLRNYRWSSVPARRGQPVSSDPPAPGGSLGASLWPEHGAPAPRGVTMRLHRVIRFAASALALAACAAIVPVSAAGAATVPIAGTIAPGAVGACTLTVGDPLIRERCTGMTETYAGGLSSTADAVFSVSLLFN